MWAKIWKSGGMIWTFNTGLLKYRRTTLETVFKFICLDEKSLLQRNAGKVGNKLWGQILKCQDNKNGFFFQQVLETLESLSFKE